MQLVQGSLWSHFTLRIISFISSCGFDLDQDQPYNGSASLLGVICEHAGDLREMRSGLDAMHLFMLIGRLLCLRILSGAFSCHLQKKHARRKEFVGSLEVSYNRSSNWSLFFSLSKSCIDGRQNMIFARTGTEE